MEATPHGLAAISLVNGIKKYFHQIQIGVFFVCIFSCFFFLKYLSDHIEESDVADYLVSLRENSTVGCLSFYERENNFLLLETSTLMQELSLPVGQLTGTSIQ